MLRAIFSKQDYTFLLFLLIPLATISERAFFLMSMLVSLYGVYIFFKYRVEIKSSNGYRIIIGIACVAFLLVLAFLFERAVVYEPNLKNSFFKPLDSYFRLVLLLPVMLVAMYLSFEKKAVASGLAFSALVMLLISLYQVFFLKIDRAFGFYNFYNLYGMVAIINALNLIFLRNSINKFFYILGFVANILVCIFTGTRGAMIAIPFLCVIFLYVDRRFFITNKFNISFLLICLTGAFIFLTPQKFTTERFYSVLNEIKTIKGGDGVNTSIGARVTMWSVGFNMLSAKPLIGKGPGAFYDELNRLVTEKKLPTMYSKFKGPHNLYVLLLAENGVILGGMFLFFIFATPFYILRKASVGENTEASKKFILIMLFFSVFFMSESILERHQGMQYFGFIWLFMIGLCLNTKTRNESSDAAQ